MDTVQRSLVRLPLILKVVVLYLLAAGCLWWVAPKTTSAPQNVGVAVKASATTATSKPQVKTIVSGQPVGLRITRLGIDLPVHDGAYDKATKTWSLAEDAALFATMTSLPNDYSGNTLIYGHNNSQVLEPVKDLATGDIAEVATSNGYVFRYAYKSDELVDPSNTAVVKLESKKPQLTLLTCEGIWSLQRRLMYFDFVEVVNNDQR